MTFLELVKHARSENRTLLTEIESKNALTEAGIEATQTILVTSAEDAVMQAETIGYPVVLKIVAFEITHKSDVGGVILNIKNSAAVQDAYRNIINTVENKHPGISIQGVSVQKMIATGTEVIIGMTTDEQFGPVIMFGLGGILVEVLNDVSFRLAPLEQKDAVEMVNEIKARPILNGIRGQTPCDLDALYKMLLSVSTFVTKYSEIKEIDLNPVIATSSGAIAVDGRIILNDEINERTNS
jgi:acyl-CoA synthetase (NDP forming)